MLSFLHAADLHLGMRITRLDHRSAQKVREARFHALDEILRAAKERAVDFVLIAGDLFDDHAVDNEVARRAYLILDAASMPVYVLPGNHDPLLPGGVWDRPPWNQSANKQVHLFRKAEPFPLGSQGQLYPCPVFRKTSLHDPTAWIAQSLIDRAFIRIGVAHGSLKVREDLPPDDHLIGRQAVRDLQLDYLALGHWHSRQLFADTEGVARTAYPGVPEPMRFQGSSEIRTGWLPYSGANRQEFFDIGKGEVLHVRIDGPGAPPLINPVEVGRLVWLEEHHQLTTEEDLSRLIGDVATRPLPERSLLRLKLSGVLDAAAMMRVGELRQILEGRYLLGDLDDAELHVQPTPEQIREVAGQGILRAVLDRLQQETQAPVSPIPADEGMRCASPEAKRMEAVRAVAERAILLLYQIAHEVNA